MENTKVKSVFLHLWENVRKFCYEKRLYFLIFFLPCAIMLTAYAFFEVHPFGKNSVLVLDLNGQYVYYYEAFRDAFWGDGSFIYNWSRNLSGEMFGIFAYYLASPFMIIILLLPRSMMTTSILLMQLAKIGTAAVTFAFFLKKISVKPPRRLSLVIFSTMYALMAYMIVQLMDPMWLDGLVYLPLICWGVHRLVNEGKLIPYIVPLALMFIAHFYIGYMVGIFTFFYFCYVCLSQEGRKLPKKFFSRCVSFGVGTLISIMCAAFVLIPVYNSLKLGKFEFSTPDFSMATQFDFLSFFAKMFPMSYDTVRPEGLPVVYCGVIALVLVPLFFMNDKITVKEKVSKAVLASLLLVSMYLKPVDIVMHGFQVPNWVPYRYSFIFSFMILVMAFKAFENLDGITAKNVGGVVFGLIVFLCWCERENYEFFQLFETKTNDNGDTHSVIQGIWVSMIAVLLYFMFIYLLKKYPKSKVVCVSMVCVICLELFTNTADTLDKIDKDVTYSKYTSYEPYMSDLRGAVDMMKEYDDEPFYRMEATFHRTVNDPIGTGYAGISHSSSTMNAPVLKMLKEMGYAYGGHYTKYDGCTPLTDALLGIKYIMDKTGDNSYVDSRIKIPSDYTLTTEYQGKKNKYKFYKNPNSLGLGVAAKGNITGVELSETNPFQNQNEVFKAITGDVRDYYTQLDIMRSETENVLTTKFTDGTTKYYKEDESQAECHVDYIVRMDKDSDLYMYLPTKWERSCNIWVQPEEEYVEEENQMSYAGQFFEGDNLSILNLGSFIKGQEIRIRITIANDENEAMWSDQLFYTFDSNAFNDACRKLQGSTLKINEFGDRSLSGTVYAEADGETLFTTIPYEEGWKIKLNGETITPQKSLNCLISIPLSQGENTIEMEFSPVYWKFSVIVSIMGFILLIFIFLVEYKKGKYFKAIMDVFKIKYVAVPNINLEKKRKSDAPDDDNISVDIDEVMFKLPSEKQEEYKPISQEDILKYVETPGIESPDDLSDDEVDESTNVQPEKEPEPEKKDTNSRMKEIDALLNEILGDSSKSDKNV